MLPTPSHDLTRELARSWSAGYLAARGSMGLNNGVVALEIRARNAWEDANRFMVPLDDLKHSLKLIESRGHETTSLYLRGDALRQAMERLGPYLPRWRIRQYEGLVQTLRERQEAGTR